MRFFLLATLFAGLAFSQGPTVVLSGFGVVQGTIDPNFPDVAVFKGIPFAQKPIGNLRFESPLMVSPWNTTLVADTFAPGCMAKACPGYNAHPADDCPANVSEDCLYLNVYAPVRTLHSQSSLPVFLFIHGGAYIDGTAGVQKFVGSRMASAENMVVVTTNYRLGAFGGLYTGAIAGNFQTQDQRMAMQFTQRVVQAFGGSPNLVTIGGQSAGGFSIATHLSSPASAPYFQRAIMDSNPVTIQASIPEVALRLAGELLSELSCPSVTDPSHVACMKAVPADILLAAQSKVLIWGAGQTLANIMKFLPVVDGVELPMQPQKALTTGAFNRVPVMLGTNANETEFFLSPYLTEPLSPTLFEIALPLMLGEAVASKALAYYGIPERFKNDTRELLSLIGTDYLFFCGYRYISRGMSTFTDVYRYYFDRVSSISDWQYSTPMAGCRTAVCHSAELPFVFNPVYPGRPAYTAADTALSATMQRAWSTFARTGSPNPLLVSSLNPSGLVTFPRYNNATLSLLNLSTPIGALSGYRDDVCNFWDTVGYNIIF